MQGPRVPWSRGPKDQDISNSHSTTSLTLKKVHLVVIIVNLTKSFMVVDGCPKNKLGVTTSNSSSNSQFFGDTFQFIHQISFMFVLCCIKVVLIQKEKYVLFIKIYCFYEHE